jgi:hypothetical protein
VGLGFVGGGGSGTPSACTRPVLPTAPAFKELQVVRLENRITLEATKAKAISNRFFIRDSPGWENARRREFFSNAAQKVPAAEREVI